MLSQTKALHYTQSAFCVVYSVYFHFKQFLIFIHVSYIPHGSTTQEAPLNTIMIGCGPIMTGECTAR